MHPRKEMKIIIVFKSTILILILSDMLPVTLPLATCLGVGIGWVWLHEKGTTGEYFDTTSYIYILTGLVINFGILSGGDPLYEWDIILIAIGFIGLLSKALVSSILGAFSILVSAFKLKSLVSPRAYLSVGIIPAAVINQFFKVFYIPVITEIVLFASGFAILGIMYSLSSLADSRLSKLISYVLSLF
jgi:hypothetical protein